MSLLKIQKKFHRIKTLFILIPIIFSSCDFASRIHKQILNAQKLLRDFKYEEAVLEYEKVLKRVPTSSLKSKIYFQLGDIYNLYLNDYKKSVYYFEKVVSESSDPRWKIQAKEKLAKIYLDHRNFKKSEEYYKQLYDFFPKLDNRDFYQMGVGISLLEQRSLKKAEEVFKEIISQKDHSFKNKAHYYLGLVKFNSKKWEEAIDHWWDYLKKETKKSEIIETKLLLANAYETMEELKKAYDIYYSLLGEYPNSKVIKNRLKSVYRRRIDRKR
ncbi:MAG: tetratricopeptide repeat protein [Bacteriovoracales bacterium]|nr:tetratricopeptide repeat protein [Bacteriovoracales bacterium]